MATATIVSYLLFVLPYSFPPAAQPRLISASYVFGFSNRVAVLALTAFVVVQSLLQTASASQLFRQASPERLNSTLVSLYLAAAVWYLALTTTIYFAVAKPEGYYKLDWESSHFIWHVRMMDLYGLKPYRDFVMDYGPAFMYLPAWSYAVLRKFGITPEGSYYVLHYLLNLVGLAALLYLVNSLGITPRRKWVAFSLVAVSAFSPPMGLSGLLLRYLLPYAGLLLVHRAYVRSREGQSRWLLVAAASSASLAAIVTSPEITVALLAAVAGYALFLLPQDRKAVVYILLSEASVLSLSLLLIPGAYFRSVINFSRGANGFPIAPVVHILFYVSIVLLCIPRLLASRVLESGAAAAYASAVGIASLAMMPAALGRCDASHVFLNGFGLFIVGFGLFGQSGKRRFAAYSIAYALIVILFFQVSNARTYGVSASKLQSGIQRISDVFSKLTGRTRPNPAEPGPAQVPKAGSSNLSDYPELDKYPALGLPFGSYGYEKSLQRHLWDKHRVVPERYMGAMSVYDQSQVDERLSEISRTPLLVIQKDYLKMYENRDLCKEQQSYLRSALLSIRVRPCVHQPLDADIEMARFIDSHYHQIERIGDYLIMKRND